MQRDRVKYIFVYGTLIRTERNRFAARLHHTAAYVSDANVRGRLYNFGLYPGAVLDRKGPDRIFGEVFAMPACADALFEVLDRYEGCHSSSPEPHMFRKEIAIADFADGRSLEVLIYTCAGDIEGRPRIHSGRFRR